jgi:hemolysin activation/secretion protein
MFGRKLGYGIAVTAMSIGVGLAANVVSADRALAQSLENVTQGFQRGPGGAVRLKARDNFSVSEDESEILPALKGVVLVNSPTEINENGTTASGVESRAQVAPAEVIAAAESFLGQPVSLASLDRLTRDMVLAFRDAGMPVVNVVIPPQDISNGVIQIVAVVGRLGEVEVTGNASDPSYYSDGLAIMAGDVVEEAAVLDHLRWKSRRFHRRVDAIYAPGAEFSQTDLTLEVTEEKPWQIFAGADNTGAGGVGDYRVFGGFMLGDLWGLDHELLYQFTTSEEGIDALQAHSLLYTMPLWDRADLQLAGSYVESSSNTAIGSVDGQSLYFGATVVQQLDRYMGWSSDLRLGFEYKKSDNDFDFGGMTVFARDTEIGQAYAQITGEQSDSSGRTNFHAGIWYSPGGLFDNNDDAAFALARPGAEAEYFYVRAGVDHTIYLPEDIRFNIDLDGQYTNDRLLPSEMFYLGGLNTVRGFDENVVRGDRGAVARFELQGAAMHLATDGAQDALRPFAFIDWGWTEVNGPVAINEIESASIAGAGVGLHYQYENNFAAELAYGWQLSSHGLAGGNNGDGQFHFRVMTSF